ncbi:MAG: copper resistance protein B [Gammaproteobacteria bacterium]|nr:copper resistance protein B [Gammaproteobacteria bacterium]
MVEPLHAAARRLPLLTLLALLLGVTPVRAEDERDAAFPELSVSMSKDMPEDPVHWMLLFDEFEWQDQRDDVLAWDAHAWIGTDRNRALLRAEGEREDGSTMENRLELLWLRPVAAYWDLVAGVRMDTEPESTRNFVGIGMQGLAPQWIEVEATVWAGENGQKAATLKLEYELLLTNRLILTPTVETDVYGEDDEENEIGSGFSTVKAGMRLRYEIRREFAPYVGIEWTGKFGDTADLARSNDEAVRDAHVVAGLRFWF